jgi:hypothetical protein
MGWELRQQWPTTSASTGPKKEKTVDRWIYDQDPQSPTWGKPGTYSTCPNPSTKVKKDVQAKHRKLFKVGLSLPQE